MFNFDDEEKIPQGLERIEEHSEYTDAAEFKDAAEFRPESARKTIRNDIITMDDIEVSVC